MRINKIILAALIIILFASVTAVIFLLYFKLENLMFWGGLIGNLFCGIATLIAVILSINSNMNAIKYQMNRQYMPYFYNVKTPKTYDEDDLLLFSKIDKNDGKLDVSTYSIISDKDEFANIYSKKLLKIGMKNIGAGSALNIRFSVGLSRKEKSLRFFCRKRDKPKVDIIYPVIESNKQIAVLYDISDLEQVECIFTVFYKDLVGNEYSQCALMRFNNGEYSSTLSYIGKDNS